LKIALGSDHAGFHLKETIKGFLQQQGYTVKDFGAQSDESVDYPDVAHEVAWAVAAGEFERGILVCGAGVGMSIAANKVRGARAVLCSDEYTARISREHNDTNILALGERTVGVELAKSIVSAWLAGTFDAGSRHARRVAKLEP
jgi:ribose 5-phosphate isomerase B